MTHGKLWPVHPKPMRDELLSSWIVRVIQANGVKLQTVTRMLFGENISPWMRDIDRTPPDWLVDTFCLNTGVDRDTAYQATLKSYKQKLFHRNRISGHQQWILTLRQAGTKRRAYGQQFCSACLSDDPVPYFRKQWRIALFTYCPAHQIELYDACPNCGMPVIFYRVDFGRDVKEATPIFVCYECGYDLRLAVGKSVYFPNGELEIMYDSVLNSLCDSECEKSLYDLGFFVVLHQIIKVMSARVNQGRLFDYVLGQVNIPNLQKYRGRITIEERRRSERHSLILSSLWLMADLNQRLYGAWKEKAVRYNLLTKDLDTAPKWYEKFLCSISDWRASG
ncbi:MAG: TniQ family protein [Candidatus Thiodiazotropha sp. (ex Troendleina suluensis)]|nr:TniQ family protein [Candidatus Thiodiazotropha sp. (ex Troendleina suluensis)]